MERNYQKEVFFMCSNKLVDKDSVVGLRIFINWISMHLIVIVFAGIKDLLCFAVGRRHLDGYHDSIFRDRYLPAVINFIFSLIMMLIISRIEIFYFLGSLIILYGTNMVSYFVIILAGSIKEKKLKC